MPDQDSNETALRHDDQSLAQLDVASRSELVRLLREAARIEHALLNAYLLAACSMKTLPVEHASLVIDGNPVDNVRRAIQFEYVRQWRAAVLTVAREEMLHLHYVNCLLRGLGERPELGLPARTGDATSSGWLVPDWQPVVAGDKQDDVIIGLGAMNRETLNRFVAYEASDALQDLGPQSPEVLALFDRLRRWELQLQIECSVAAGSGADRDAAARLLEQVYEAMPPAPARVTLEMAARIQAAAPPLPVPTFRSIADLYQSAILPLLGEAFDFGWMKHANRDLLNELLDSTPAAQGFLDFVGIGPVYRGKNFEKLAEANYTDPLRHFKRARDIIHEIVDEGEGFVDLVPRATALLAISPGDYAGWLRLPAAQRPPAFDDGERLRQAHLYRFALARAQLDHERALCERAGAAFDAERAPLDVAANATLGAFAAELAPRFNAVYLVLWSWLARLYEIDGWRGDKDARSAVEMLASWPLMSLAIRPFLELASQFGPAVRAQLFRQDEAGLPVVPVHAVQLHRLAAAPARSEAINERMDYLALRVLEDTAQWAAASAADLGPILTGASRQIILARLDGLSRLGEFKRQFPYRMAGGYSGTAPGTALAHPERDARRYEEDPTGGTLAENALVLRLRFRGWGRVQLATDPEPPTEEAGCTGTHMLHATDGEIVLDRSLFWQPNSAAIDREPIAPRTGPGAMPTLGVDCVEVAVMAAASMTAAYRPLGTMDSQGAVQASGVQLDLEIDGAVPIATWRAPGLSDPTGASEVHLDLLPSATGRRPFLVGENHLVWQDGEPIDPFILSVRCDGSAASLTREVWNEQRSMMQFDPLQRTLSRRAPIGFDDPSNLPDWLRPYLPSPLASALASPQYPRSYLQARGARLFEALRAIPMQASRDRIDAIVSCAERLRRINVPRGTTVGWLTAVLHYGHTVSGRFGHDDDGRSSPLLREVAARIGLDVALARPDQPRQQPNGRWLLRYSLGLMDTDALANFAYGELFIPLAVTGDTRTVRFGKRWAFSPRLRDTARAYACRFEAPFWAAYDVAPDRKTRSLRNPGGGVVTETCERADASGYTVSVAGVPGAVRVSIELTLEEHAGSCALVWNVEFEAESAARVVAVALWALGVAAQVGDAFIQELSPRSAE